MTFVIVDT